MRTQSLVKGQSWGFLIVSTLMEMCVGYKILVVFPNPSRSHGNLGDGMVRHLLKAGHEVTYITPFVKNTSRQNLSYVDVSVTNQIFAGSPYNLKEMMKNKALLEQHSIFQLMKNISELALENDNVRIFLEDSNQKFDLVIAEWMFNELYSGFAAVYKCPYIWVFPFEPNFVALSLIDESTNPSYAANFELNIVPPYSFLERVRNLWFQISYRLNYYYYYDSVEKDMYARIFGPVLLKKYGSIVSYDTLRYNASLMLSNSHYSLGQALSIPQNLIPVGGYHVYEKPTPLPEDLKSIMDKATNGVVYFSMGSNLKSKDFPKHIEQSLKKVFSSVKYTVLWKFEGDITGYSDNVHILKWAPQQSILAHPNCVLFITHGGLLSTIEAVHYGIPMIGIPVFYDQFDNVDRAVHRGVAKKVLLTDNFGEELKAAIVDILTDPRYAAKAKEFSFIYHNRPIPPGDAIVHWVEHVVATRGAPHLRSPAIFLPWYQKLYVDLFAIVFLLVICIGWSLTTVVNRWSQSRADILGKKTD